MAVPLGFRLVPMDFDRRAVDTKRDRRQPFALTLGPDPTRREFHVNILEMNGESYRLAQSRARKADDRN